MVQPRVWDVVASLSGVVAVGLYGVSIIFMDTRDAIDAIDPPNEAIEYIQPSDPAQTIAQVLAAHRDDAQTAAYFGLASAFLFMWFFSYVRSQFRRTEGTNGWLTSVAYGSGLVLTGLLLVAVSFALAQSEIVNDADPQVAKTLFVYEWNATAIQSAPLAALAAATTLLGFRHGAIPRWLTWLGVPIVILMLAFGVSGPGVASGIGYFWLALLALTLGVRAWRTSSAPTISTSQVT